MKKYLTLLLFLIELGLLSLTILYKDLFYLVPLLILGIFIIISNTNLNFSNSFVFKINKKFLFIGSLVVLFVLCLPTLGKFIQKYKVKKASNTNIQKKQICDENETLKKAKQCTFPIIRDDDSHGSGFSIKNNYIITNKHVIEGATKLYTKINGEEVELKVWNYSPSYDIAILKTSKNIPTCNWFNSEQLNVAETLYAVGWPIEYDGESTVSKGIFSRLYEYNSTNYIQTDTPINPGNSGGPLINKCGIVGINTIKVSAEGIEGMGFALPSSELIKITDRLIEEGADDTEIPIAIENSNQSKQNNYVAPNTTRSINIEDVRTYLSSLYGVRDSWEQGGNYSQEDRNKLIDSLNRQINFCETLVSRLTERNPTQDDIFMWDSVVKMSYESSLLANKLLGK